MTPVTLLKSELFRQGGLEKYTWQIARDFCALGCPVTVLTTGAITPPFSDPLLNLVSLPIKHPFSFLNVLHFDKASADYLASHPTPLVFSLDRTRRQTHIRAGNGVHAAFLERRAREEGLLKKASFALNPLHRAILSLEKKAFEDSHLKTLFTNSAMVKSEVLQHYSINPDKVRVVHNGVEWHALQEKFDAWQAERSSGPFRFLFIGHNYRRKGLDKLLAALSRIQHEDFHLLVVGKDKDPAYFQEMAARLGLANKVSFLGPQPQAAPFYQNSDCLVVPSLYDPFANVTVEALAMGLYVVSSRHNGGHEILTPETGTLIESLDDPQTFAQTLQKALARPKTPASALAIRASAARFDFSKQLRLMTQFAVNQII